MEKGAVRARRFERPLSRHHIPRRAPLRKAFESRLNGRGVVFEHPHEFLQKRRIIVPRAGGDEALRRPDGDGAGRFAAAVPEAGWDRRPELIFLSLLFRSRNIGRRYETVHRTGIPRSAGALGGRRLPCQQPVFRTVVLDDGFCIFFGELEGKNDIFCFYHAREERGCKCVHCSGRFYDFDPGCADAVGMMLMVGGRPMLAVGDDYVLDS